MSDYTVKREKEGILRIQAEGTKMPGPLTINERDYADDKQLIVGGGSSSPLRLAKVKFVVDDSNRPLGSCFRIGIGLPMYCPSGSTGFAETTSIFASEDSIGSWNDAVDGGYVFLIIPYVLYKLDATFTYTLEGAAEFGHDDDGNYIKITGDCTITVNASTHVVS